MSILEHGEVLRDRLPAEIDVMFGRKATTGLYGEVGGAFVRPALGAHIDETELFAYARERPAPRKTPKHWITVDEFRLTGSGKIQK